MTGDSGAPDEQFWFARLDGKLDDIRSIIGGHGEKLAEHGVRLDNVEGDVTQLRQENAETKQARAEERRHRAMVRWTVVAAVIGGVFGIVGGLIALIH